MHTRTHALMRALMHAQTRTCTHSRAHTPMHTRTRACTPQGGLGPSRSPPTSPSPHWCSWMCSLGPLGATSFLHVLVTLGKWLTGPQFRICKAGSFWVDSGSRRRSAPLVLCLGVEACPCGRRRLERTWLLTPREPNGAAAEAYKGRPCGPGVLASRNRRGPMCRPLSVLPP